VIRALALLLFGRRGQNVSRTDARMLSFARGLALGALVGAAIAGSSIWRRQRRED
jgi:hypothetical protein